MSATRQKIVWEGAKTLRRFLVPIDDLEPFAGNPRRGNVEKIAESLRGIGQRRPITVSGRTITAGHHVVLAARSLEWTHVAALDGDFDDEDHARRFLLADNRTAEFGTVDQEMLAVQLESLSNYDGTGFTAEDKAELDRQLAAIRAAYQPTDERPPSLDARSGTSGLFEVPLLLGVDDRKDFAQLMKMHQREWGIADVTSVVLRLLRESAARL